MQASTEDQFKKGDIDPIGIDRILREDS